jgi:hypothetical protein
MAVWKLRASQWRCTEKLMLIGPWFAAEALAAAGCRGHLEGPCRTRWAPRTTGTLLTHHIRLTGTDRPAAGAESIREEVPAPKNKPEIDRPLVAWPSGFMMLF